MPPPSRSRPLPLRAASLLAAGLLALAGPGAQAVRALQGPEQSGPVVGLALSGGAARGLAHIGVIQELEARGIQVHVVAGTSMGSLIGGLFAMGLEGDSLEAVARRLNREDVFNDRVPRSFMAPDQRMFDERTLLTLPIREGRVQLPEAAVEGMAVRRALAREFWPAQGVESFADLPRPFVALATDLRTGEAVVLRRGVLADAVRASVAIPGLLEPQEQGGRLLVDGALVRNLPAEDARTLGAELLICSDVGRSAEAREFRSLMDILSVAVTLGSEGDRQRQYDQCDVVLRPVSDELDAADFDALDTWIRIGRDAVAGSAGEIAAAFAQRRVGGSLPTFLRARPRVAAPLFPPSVRVRDIRFVGLAREDQEAPARRALRLERGEVVDAASLDRAMAALQATELYQGVGYRLIPGAEGEVDLEVELRPAQRDRLGMGFRFDDQYKAAVLLSATLLSRLGYGSSTRLDARLGDAIEVRLTHQSGRGITSALGLGFSAGFTRVPISFSRDGERFFQIRNEQIHLAGMFTLVQRSGGLLALELRGEQVRERPEVGGGLSTRRRRYGSASLTWIRDTFDRADFPTTGSSLLARTEWSRRALGTGADFEQHLAELRVAVPVTPAVTLRLEAFAGSAAGDDLPLYKNFFLGGSVTPGVLAYSHPLFHGMESQDEWGRVAQVLRSAVQVEFSRNWFVTALVNAGDVRDAWALKPEDWIAGWGVSLGHLSLLGPARLALVGRDDPGRFRVTLELGRTF
ncbi:MAG: patatin-like phospholipase family protein [Longimicrobiales bacterium]|nr:patatin-like phospholipase family protein [Longimicrobiales bacterium]